jgi:hypothetical protein
MNNDFKPFRPRHGVRPQAKPSTPGDPPEPSFKTPEQAAAADLGSVALPVKPVKGKKRSFWQRLRHPDLTRKQIIIISVVVGLIIASALIWWFAIRKKPEPPKPAPRPVAKQEEPPPKPTTVPSRLTGIQVPPELDALPTTGVMIENSPDARPQSALIDAGVVFEAIAEGGITRFLAIFQETKPAYIGPVRSVRPYYLDFLAPFDAAIAHAGGSAQALAEVRSQGFKDLDHGANGSTYQRVSNRFAPHNLYTSRDKLLAAQTAKGWATSNFTGFEPRKVDKPVVPATAKTLDFAISGFLYNPHFDYAAQCNCYIRSEGGKPHVDEKTGIQIQPKNVVALVMSHRYAGIYSVYGTTGGGIAFFFQDGGVTQGSWQKTDRKSQFKFLDPAGAPFAINAGQTWVSIVSAPTAVVYKP